MRAPDWPLLLAVVNDRAAIYAETFPALWDAAPAEVRGWLDHAEAADVLSTFAAAWPSLGRNDAVDPPGVRWQYRAVPSGSFAVAFRGRELAPGAIVVDSLKLHERP